MSIVGASKMSLSDNFNGWGMGHLKSQGRHQDHRRNGIDDGRDRTRCWSNLEENHRRQKVREERQRLQDGKDRSDGAINVLIFPRQNPEQQTNKECDRRRDRDNRERLHRQVPLADERRPDERATRDRFWL